MNFPGVPLEQSWQGRRFIIHPASISGKVDA
jgi:hypothetical protein